VTAYSDLFAMGRNHDYIYVGDDDGNQIITTPADGIDIIMDFDTGLDKLDVSAFGRNAEYLFSLMTQNGADTELTTARGTIILKNTVLSKLTVDIFDLDGLNQAGGGSVST
jgi:Ca2+-binding RTX toxin-like protein